MAVLKLFSWFLIVNIRKVAKYESFHFTHSFIMIDSLSRWHRTYYTACWFWFCDSIPFPDKPTKMTMWHLSKINWFIASCYVFMIMCEISSTNFHIQLMLFETLFSESWNIQKNLCGVPSTFLNCHWKQLFRKNVMQLYILTNFTAVVYLSQADSPSVSSSSFVVTKEEIVWEMCLNYCKNKITSMMNDMISNGDIALTNWSWSWK